MQHLRAPNLDDRRFQALVDEAKGLIPTKCRGWTDHNVSDPGITLIELFAWMTEQYLFRLNQVPDKNYITFLDLIGVRLEPARPARGDVTFTLSASPAPGFRIRIPAWTEVATERTELEEAVVFTTDYEVEVQPASPRWLLTTVGDGDYQDQSKSLKGPGTFDAWGSPPLATHALYVGLEEDLSTHTLVLEFDCRTMGIGIDPDDPPWRWEVWRGNELQWQQVAVASDTTKGLNRKGKVELYLPYGCQPLGVQGREAGTWVRCSPVVDLPPGKSPYDQPPRIREMTAYTIGITVPVTHAIPVGPEVLGISNGQPGQLFSLLHSNILKPEGPEEVIEVSTPGGGWEVWEMKADFGESKPDDKHCVFDPITGEVEFGPAIRQRNEKEPQFGAIPPTGQAIRIRRFRVGGGFRGNVAAGRVKVLKSTLPYVAGVDNRAAITGGEEAQSLDDAKLRAPATLRARWRAVTAEDFEYLSEQVEGVGRVRCLQPRPGMVTPEIVKGEQRYPLHPAKGGPGAPPPGVVTLLVIPNLPPLEGPELERHIDVHESLSQLPSEGRLAVERQLEHELKLAPATDVRLRDFLDERRLLTTRIEVSEPQYIWVTVQTRIQALPKAEPERVKRDVKTALYRFMHPLYGGPDGKGWPFGRALTVDKVYALIQDVPGVEYATELKLYPINFYDPLGQRLPEEWVQMVDVPANAVVASYYHNVYVVTH